MSKRDAKKAQNRVKLIDSAAKSFATDGVKGANINLISLQAGLGKGTVYNYFSSKDELLLAVLDRAGEVIEPIITKATVETGTADQRLRSVVAALFDFYSQDPSLTKLLLRAVADDSVEMQRRILAAFQPVLDRFQAAMEAGLSRQELRNDLDPFLSAITLWGMVNHQAAFHWLVSSRPLDPEALTDFVMTYFMAGTGRI